MKRVEAGTSYAWLLLGFAVALETAGAIGLRFSEGFTLVLPTLAALAAFTLALYLVSRVMKRLPVSVAYPVRGELVFTRRPGARIGHRNAFPK
jgi:multidrug transporter EmrE-like cation transporter